MKATQITEADIENDDLLLEEITVTEKIGMVSATWFMIGPSSIENRLTSRLAKEASKRGATHFVIGDGLYRCDEASKLPKLEVGYNALLYSRAQDNQGEN